MTTNLQNVRLKLNLSQNDLAEISGIPKRTIQHYEIKSRNIDKASLDTLCSLSFALHCNISDILESEELKKKINVAFKL